LRSQRFLQGQFEQRRFQPAMKSLAKGSSSQDAFVVIDELVEAANVPDGLGVQCHPERMVRAHEADKRDSLSPIGDLVRFAGHSDIARMR
jgi:hypothetical protein